MPWPATRGRPLIGSAGCRGSGRILSALFIDTSALAKRYLGEVGSSWVRAVTAPATGNVVIISELTTVELASLLARRVREGTLSRPDAAALEGAFLLHARTEYLVLQRRVKQPTSRCPVHAVAGDAV